MIIELEEKNFFFQEDEIFRKYFLIKKTSHIEQKKFDELIILIKDFCKKVYNEDKYDFFISEYYDVGYLEDYGYYTISDVDRGYRYVSNLGENTYKAFIKIVIDILASQSINYEFENRKKLEQDYAIRFKNLEYFNCLYFAEIALEQWNKYYNGNILKDIINYYENYLNDIWWSQENNITWEFNTNSNLFVFKKKEKIKKIEK